MIYYCMRGWFITAWGDGLHLLVKFKRELIFKRLEIGMGWYLIFADTPILQPIHIGVTVIIESPSKKGHSNQICTISQYRHISNFFWLPIPILPILKKCADISDTDTGIGPSLVGKTLEGIHFYVPSPKSEQCLHLGGWVGVCVSERWPFRFQTGKRYTLILKKNSKVYHFRFSLLLFRC